MKLRKRAKGVLEALRPKQYHVPNVKSSKPAISRFSILLRSSDPPNAENEEQTRQAGADKQERDGAGTIKSITLASEINTPIVPAPAPPPFSVLGKRSRDKMGHTAIEIHEDEQDVEMLRRLAPKDDEYMDLSEDEDSNDASVSDDSDDSDDDIDETVMEDMRKLEESFKGISQKYRLINRIGEGTFSTVYKAHQLPQREPTEDGSDVMSEDTEEMPLKKRKTNSRTATSTRNCKKIRTVALKKIYVTSSPHRILNELELLHELRDSPYICPLLTAFRHLDQVVAVLPYFRHLDFRLYYRDFLVEDMRHYFSSLLRGLAHVHKAGILHRDIKPTNFLFDNVRREGVLVDFGLAERQGTDWQPCLCLESRDKRRDKFLNSFAVQVLQTQPDLVSTGFPKSDSRPSRRANRAGTRGFRAPEVLLKCTSQTTKIDIWSAGVILLTLLARRFPFFNSADDVDAMIEIASIFGRKKMQAAAAMHGQLFETSIETIGERGFSLEKIILWASCREKEQDGLRAGEAQAVLLLQGLLELDAGKRFSAKEALMHEFFTAPVEDAEERAERLEAVGARVAR
ncbi:hypothetical protein B0A52_00845 [Exophiala mesophila]|uniref:non-specific serine/threonine protein kinase n=1 Tax=Exophiala mesophila TaxID=212818 RepID=A0A438NID3_EXOME|nr:hypothetical protein B0A52_00845 [Exophiala mesophila]